MLTDSCSLTALKTRLLAAAAQVELLAAEIYDPTADSWTTIATPAGWTEIGDGTEVYPFASIGLTPQDLKYRGEDTRLRAEGRRLLARRTRQAADDEEYRPIGRHRGGTGRPRARQPQCLRRMAREPIDEGTGASAAVAAAVVVAGAWMGSAKKKG